LLFRKKYGLELRGEKSNKEPRLNEDINNEEQNIIKYFLKTPFMYILIVVAISFWLVGSMVDFQYTKIMNTSFGTEKSLGLYFSCYTLVYSISAIAIQIFFAGSFLKRIGAERGLFALPAVSILGGMGILISFSFIFGFLLRYMWDIIGMSIQANAFQLTQNAIPGRLRGRVRGILDGIINPGGSIVAGFLIIFLNRLVNYHAYNTELITVLLIFIAVFWLASVVIGHKFYVSALVRNLKSNDKQTAFDAIESLGEPFCKKSLGVLLELLKSKNVEFRKKALLSLPLTRNSRADLAVREHENNTQG
jgi:ATP/ADP translocase